MSNNIHGLFSIHSEHLLEYDWNDKLTDTSVEDNIKVHIKRTGKLHKVKTLNGMN